MLLRDCGGVYVDCGGVSVVVCTGGGWWGTVVTVVGVYCVNCGGVYCGLWWVCTVCGCVLDCGGCCVLLTVVTVVVLWVRDCVVCYL